MKEATVILLVVAIALSSTLLTHPLRQGRVDDSVHEAFRAIVDAYNAGGNVTSLVSKLNDALDLISRADEVASEDPELAHSLISQANSTLTQILEEAPEVAEEGRRRVFIGRVVLTSSAVAAAVVGVSAYIYGPRLFWRLWVRLRRRHRVRAVKVARERGSMIISGEVWAVICAVLLVGAVFAVSQYVRSRRVVEPFSALGVLGPNMKIGDYPSEVVAGETFRLYVYVLCYEGKPMLYTVYVKLGNESTPINGTTPAPLEPMYTLTHALMHNETWVTPIDITLTEPGINYRLIFELWAYDPETDSMVYTGRWCQLWLNVTAPP